MRRTVTGLLAMAALCAALPAAAQEEPPADDADTTIVVTGQAEEPTAGEAADQAEALSRVGRFQLYEETLPRFGAPLCPATFGIRADYAAEILERIRANAVRLDIPLGEADCVSNLVVAFVDDGGAFVSRLAERQPAIFRLIAAPERAEIMAEEAPVRVWNNIGLVWTGNSAPPPGWPKARPSVRGQLNRAGMPESKVISSAAVLFEQEAVIGMTLTQIADYATMRALTHTRPASGDEPMATILALFAGGSPPEELTSFDLGYLRSLYRGALNQSAASRFVRVRSAADDAPERGAP